ncbi:MAG: hypothetical protein ACLQU2_31310 [Candidatus Binataceae bacterium]
MMRKLTLIATGISSLLFAILLSYSSSLAVSNEKQVSAADNTVAVPANSVVAVATNTVSITPTGVNGVHIYTIQASIGDAGPLATQGKLTLLHTEIRATLIQGTAFTTIQVPLQYEVIGATLYVTFRYRLKSVGAASGSDVGTSPTPFDLINTVVSGHTADTVQLSASFGIKNNDTVSHSVIMGINALEATF